MNRYGPMNYSQHKYLHDVPDAIVLCHTVCTITTCVKFPTLNQQTNHSLTTSRHAFIQFHAHHQAARIQRTKEIRHHNAQRLAGTNPSRRLFAPTISANSLFASDSSSQPPTSVLNASTTSRCICCSSTVSPWFVTTFPNRFPDGRLPGLAIIALLCWCWNSSGLRWYSFHRSSR